MSAATFTEQYDRLVAALGDDPLGAGAPLQRAGDPAKAAVAAAEASPAERKRALEELASSSLRCAELIAQTLETSSKLSKLQKRLADAAEKRQVPVDGDEEMDGKSSGAEESEEEEDDDEGDEQSVLLLRDLTAAGAQLEEAAARHAQLGVVSKALRSSRALLSSAERDLSAARTAGGGSEALDATLQSEFRDLYMEEFTSAFGDSLDQFRREEQFESRDVAYLISCIHAGGDIFSPLQKKLFVESAAASGASA